MFAQRGHRVKVKVTGAKQLVRMFAFSVQRVRKKGDRHVSVISSIKFSDSDETWYTISLINRLPNHVNVFHLT